MLGLLGLLLGFTFSMGVNRYETRRDFVLKEANAIGTTYLRAGFLPEAQQEPVKALLRQYLDVRIQTHAAARDIRAVSEGLRRSQEIQNALWQQAEAVAKQAPTPSGVWFLLIFVAAAGCFGVPGLITFRLAACWPTRVACPHCSHERPLESEECPACHQAWPPPKTSGTEIFADSVG